MIKVCKFGGTSMANAAAIMASKNVVLSDESRKFVVVSAPGKRAANDTKVTDLLYAAYNDFRKGKSAFDSLTDVKKRIDTLVADLKLDLDTDAEFDLIAQKLQKGCNEDYIASRGEYFAALIVSKLLNFSFIDAAELIKFDENGAFMAEYTNDLIRARLSKLENAVIAGFYGAKPDGTIKTFSRGGSDVSGAIIARGAKADIYENWTDVNGFMICDPKIIKNPKKMEILTYKELRELSYMGANVLHPESIFPVRKSNIPINIKNTFEPENSGTLIVPTKHYFEKKYHRREQVVTGIAGKKDFLAITLEKSMLNSELGAVRKLLTVLEFYNVSFEHMPTGIDTLSVIIDKGNIDMSKLPQIVEAIKAALMPDMLEVSYDIALIAIVGHNMSMRPGTAAAVFNALAENKINIKMIDQGSSELNIIIGVSNENYERAIEALYNKFF